MAEERQESRSRYWLWGVAGWLGITAICLLTHLGSLQADLADRSQAAVAAAGLTGAIADSEIDFTGEIATLRGTVTDPNVREQIASVVADVRGVRRINNEIEVVAPATPTPAEPAPAEPPPTTAAPAPVPLASPELTATRGADMITLSGRVPSQEVADAWIESATAVFGEGNVVDQLTVTDGVAEEGWLAGGEALRFLAATSEGSFAIADGSLVATGLTPNQATHDQVLAGLSNGFPALSIVDRLEIAPQASDEIAALDLSGIRFETARATISAESIPILDEAVEVLAAFPDVAVEVAGHTDSDGSAAANLALSQARADAVFDYLVENGIAPDRLSAVGYGEEQPIADNATPEGKAQNRRIEFVITEGE